MAGGNDVQRRSHDNGKIVPLSVRLEVRTCPPIFSDSAHPFSRNPSSHLLLYPDFAHPHSASGEAAVAHTTGAMRRERGER